MLATIIACSKVPITGRKQMSLIPETELISMSLTQYSSFLKTNPPAGNHDQNTIIVKQIGNKIQQAVTKYMSQNKLSSRLAGYKWEFNLVNDPMVNAWCMPGGKQGHAAAAYLIAC